LVRKYYYVDSVCAEVLYCKFHFIPACNISWCSLTVFGAPSCTSVMGSSIFQHRSPVIHLVWWHVIAPVPLLHDSLFEEVIS
jgi:hypothetical protein